MHVGTAILVMTMPCYAFLAPERVLMTRPGWCPRMFSGNSDNNVDEAGLESTVDIGETKKGYSDDDVDTTLSGTQNPLRLAVLKLGVTEPRFTSPLNYEERDGIYNCAGCGTTLFDSRGKYNSGSGWPSFWCSIEQDRVKLTR